MNLNRLLLSLLFLFTIVSSDAQDTLKNKLKLAAIPLINYNSTQGICIGALVSGYYKVNKNDTISPSSNTGVAGIYTSEKSHMLFLFQKLYLDQDNWRILAAGGDMDINFQFYYEDPVITFGNFVDYSIKANFAAMQIQRKVYKRLYAGLTGAYISSETTFKIPPELGGDSTTISKLNNLGYILTTDSRDNVYYPFKGIFFNFKNQFYRDWTGSNYNFTRYMINYNQFFSLTDNEKKIIAVRANCSIATGDVPFEGQTVVGQDDIRGYSQGRYRANEVYTLQGEYRWSVYKKFGLVGFVGIASAVNTFKDISSSPVLPGIGVGLRYRMIPSEKINVGIDVGVGKDDYSITFRIGESFAR